MLRLMQFVLFLSAGLLLALASAAQPGGGPVISEPTAVPLDGGALVLLAGGLTYGWRAPRRPA